MDITRWRELKQQWLPFEEEEKKEPQKPLPHFENPESDNQKLLELQYQYKNGKPEAMDEFYRLSAKICLKFIYDISKENPYVRRLSLEDKKIKAHDAATYLPTQYLKRPDFAIRKNVPGYLYLRVQRELFHRRKCDTIVDFVDLSAFFKEGTEDDEENKWTT